MSDEQLLKFLGCLAVWTFNGNITQREMDYLMAQPRIVVPVIAS